MTYIFVSTLTGISMMLFILVDQDLSIKPHFTENQAIVYFIFSLILSLSGFGYGIHKYGW